MTETAVEAVLSGDLPSAQSLVSAIPLEYVATVDVRTGDESSLLRKITRWVLRQLASGEPHFLAVILCKVFAKRCMSKVVPMMHAYFDTRGVTKLQRDLPLVDKMVFVYQAGMIKHAPLGPTRVSQTPPTSSMTNKLVRLSVEEGAAFFMTADAREAFNVISILSRYALSSREPGRLLGPEAYQLFGEFTTTSITSGLSLIAAMAQDGNSRFRKTILNDLEKWVHANIETNPHLERARRLVEITETLAKYYNIRLEGSSLFEKIGSFSAQMSKRPWESQMVVYQELSKLIGYKVVGVEALWKEAEKVAGNGLKIVQWVALHALAKDLFVDERIDTLEAQIEQAGYVPQIKEVYRSLPPSLQEMIPKADELNEWIAAGTLQTNMQQRYKKLPTELREALFSTDAYWQWVQTGAPPLALLILYDALPDQVRMKFPPPKDAGEWMLSRLSSEKFQDVLERCLRELPEDVVTITPTPEQILQWGLERSESST